MEGESSKMCIFREILKICNNSKYFTSKKLSDVQKSTIVKCSQERQDEFHGKMNSEFVIRDYHKDCYAAYTSKEKIERYLRKGKTLTKLTTEEKVMPFIH